MKQTSQEGAGTAAQPKKKRFVYKLITRTAVIAALIGCTATVVSVHATIAEKEAELEQIRTQIENLQAENADLERIIASGDIDAYMEKLAREKYGYAYPDEFRFYDASRN